MKYMESRASEHSTNVELEIKKLQKKFRDLRITYFMKMKICSSTWNSIRYTNCIRLYKLI